MKLSNSYSSMKSMPKKIKLVEVGPRDGLQNESFNLPTELKIELIEKLADCGLTHIESSSFVSPHKIPQLADAMEVMTQLKRKTGVIYSVLVPNLKGLEHALPTHVQEIAFFTTVSETFCQKNINCTIKESLERLASFIPLAQQHHIPIRAYISCALGCPYEGKIAFEKTAKLAEELINLGCYEISLSDTIGIGTPLEVAQLIEATEKYVSLPQLAVHFHDTYGQALANILMALQMGIHVIDSSVAGLGGCPYAKGASGNVATEDVLYLLNGLGLETGVDLIKLSHVGQWICQQLNHETRSKVGKAMES